MIWMKRIFGETLGPGEAREFGHLEKQPGCVARALMLTPGASISLATGLDTELVFNAAFPHQGLRFPPDGRIIPLGRPLLGMLKGVVKNEADIARKINVYIFLTC